MNKYYLYVTILISLSGCTDAEIGNFKSFGDSATIACYSGGQKVYSAITTGKVGSLEGGGWAFKTTNGEYVQTFADCFVTVKQ